MTKRPLTIYSYFTSQGHTMTLMPQGNGRYMVLLDQAQFDTHPTLQNAFIEAHQIAVAKGFDLPVNLQDWTQDNRIITTTVTE